MGVQFNSLGVAGEKVHKPGTEVRGELQLQQDRLCSRCCSAVCKVMIMVSSVDLFVNWWLSKG